MKNKSSATKNEDCEFSEMVWAYQTACSPLYLCFWNNSTRRWLTFLSLKILNIIKYFDVINYESNFIFVTPYLHKQS